MHDEDNDGRFPDESPVEVRYPRSKQEEQGDRERRPWLPATIVVSYSRVAGFKAPVRSPEGPETAGFRFLGAAKFLVVGVARFLYARIARFRLPCRRAGYRLREVIRPHEPGQLPGHVRQQRYLRRQVLTRPPSPGPGLHPRARGRVPVHRGGRRGAGGSVRSSAT